MKTLKTSLFLVLPLLLGACGSQLVDFPVDGGNGGAEDSGTEDAGNADAHAPRPDGGGGNTDAANDGAERSDGADANTGNSDAANPDATNSDATNWDASTLDAPNSDAAMANDGAALDASPDATNDGATTPDAANDAGATADAGDGSVATLDSGNDGAANPDAGDDGGAVGDAGDAGIANLDAGDAGDADAASSDAADASAASSDAGDANAANLDAGDAMAPEVVSTNPADGAVKVSISEILTATFNESMNPTTLNATTFTLRAGPDASMDSSIAGTVTYADGGDIATFVPSANLAINTLYTATISTGAMDLYGSPLAKDYVWDFTTSACAEAPIALGAADSFAVLAYSTVTSTGPTSVTGNIGLWTGPSVTGFPPGTFVGSEYVADPTAAAAQGSLTTAYNDAAGRSLCAVTVAGNIGGETLTPGLYMSTSSLAVSSGNLTLDAQGDPDAVFIFQMATTLTVTSGLQVILSGGAKATNIFWQVGSSATLGTTSVFQGTIMAAASISMDTGATLNGRALASNGAVTMQSNTIVIPAK